MLDHFQFGRVDRISPEAPVPVVTFARDEYRLGGAANVAHNVAALGGRPRVVGLVGDDAAARDLRRGLGDAAIDDSGLVVDTARPTTRKLRIVTLRNQQVARVDFEADGEASAAVEDALVRQVSTAAAGANAIVLSDYRKGVVTPRVIAAAIAAGRAAGVPVLVDPKVPKAERYQGASLLTPNHHEAELMTQTTIRTTDDIRQAARLLHERTGSNVLITWGEHGMWVLDRTGGRTVEESLPAAAREVADVTGAGDTVIAVLALGLAAGASLSTAARLANLAAGLVVAHFGPAAPTMEELRSAVTTGNEG
jgi:D-beta-D-heptose 7-phosphate kinase/D-beta-D-heptose 1-phosphate adenosyltransferase